MKLTVAAFLLALPVVAARRPRGKISRGNKVRPTKNMMRNAKHVGGAKLRHLEDENNNNNQDEQERDITWMYQYSLAFDSCHTATTIRQEGQGDAEFGNLLAVNSIQFNLCPTSGSGGCATYLAPMMDFLDAYTEAQMEEEEYQCEIAREQCEYQYEMQQNQNGNNNNGNNEQYYMNECYQAMGLDYCMEYEGQEEFEIQQYLECAEWEGNNEYSNYFIGPYCADSGASIYLGMFQDGGCAIPAKNGLEMFSKYAYGRELPYSTESLVDPYKKISCQQVDQDAQNYNYNNGDNNNQNNNQNYNYNQDVEINQLCEQMYELSARCEKGLDKESNYYWSPDNEACDYIANTLPSLDAAAFSGSTGSSSSTAKIFAWIFGLSTVALGGYVFYLHKNKDRKVDLSSQGDAAQA
mmetsp:Transcript_13293/g.28864  ORF Transcript_13293/g.28864 Transcript_13293/m.28864 type:complete len:409 (-) Transcript_13293:297-1523(-)